MHTLGNNNCIRHHGQRRAMPRRLPWSGLLLCCPTARQCLERPPHAFLRPQDDLAERTKEVWDDEEDIEAAVKRLGPSQAAKPGSDNPLFSQINELYTQQQFPQGHVGPVELRYVAGRGYGLFVTSRVQQGQVLAVCPPLTWVSGPPGQPPSLSDLITHMRRSRFSPAQRRALASLCSLPGLEQQLEQQQHEQRQQQQRDRLLAAAEKLQREQGFRGQSQGSGSSSLPLSASSRIKAMQRRLKEQRGFLNDQDDAEEDEEDDEGGEGDQGLHFSDNGSSSLARSGSASSGSMQQQQQRFPAARATPELLQLLEATQEAVPPAAAAGAAGGGLDAAAAAAAAASGGSTRAWGAGWTGRRGSTASISRSESRPAAAAAGGSSGAGLLDLPLDRLTALVCRNALTEPSQDLAASLTRRDRLSSLTGIWPLLAVINHSCAANAVAVVLGEVPPPPPQPQQPQLGAGGRPLNALVSAALQRKSARAAAAAAFSSPVNPWRSGGRAQQQQQDAGSGSGSSSSSSKAQQQLQPARHPPSSVQSWSGGAGAGSSSSGPFVLVRAVHSMEPGDEVMLDYLGSFPEGSFVDPERRRLALAKRWGFTCRCERCIAEQQLGKPIQRSQLAANQLAAGLGPDVTAAAADAPRAAGAAPPAAADGGAVEVLSDAVARLREATLQVEQQLDQPSIPGRVAGWAHASLYQAHALSALARLALEPRELGSVAAIGTCMELAGMAAPGSAAHQLNAGALVNASLEQWGETSERVEAAARTMLQVLQLRYGPLEATTAQQLAAATQFWADEAAQTRLSLLSPAASAAAQARKKQQPLAATPAAAPAGARRPEQQQQQKRQQVQQQQQEEPAEEEEVDEVAAALELDAEAVLEVTEELLGDLYGSGVEPQQQQIQQGSRPAATASGAGGASDDLVFVKQRSEAELQAELQMFAGITEQLSPEQKQELWRRQQQQEQQAAAEPAAGDAAAAGAAEAGAGAAAADAADGDEGEEGEAAAQELPILTSWLQSEAGQEDEAEDEELLPQQPQPQQERQPAPSTGPLQQQPAAPAQSPAAAAGLRERMAAAAAAAAAAANPVAGSSSGSSSSSRTAASGRRPAASGPGGRQQTPSTTAAEAAVCAGDRAGGAVGGVDRAASDSRPPPPDGSSGAARVARAAGGRRVSSLAQTSGPQSLFKKTSQAQEAGPGAAAGSTSGVPKQRQGRPAASRLLSQGGKAAAAAAGPGAAGSDPAPQQRQEKSQKERQ